MVLHQYPIFFGVKHSLPEGRGLAYESGALTRLSYFGVSEATPRPGRNCIPLASAANPPAMPYPGMGLLLWPSFY